MLLHFVASVCILKYKCNTAKLDSHKHTVLRIINLHILFIKKYKQATLYSNETVWYIYSHGASATVLKNYQTLEVYVAVEIAV